MGKSVWIGSGCALLAAAAAFTAPQALAQDAYRGVRPDIQVQPPPNVVIVQPGPVRTWVPGHWEQHHHGHVWVEGHWIVSHPGVVQHHRRPGGRDQDRDGVPNRSDRDIDGDGVLNWRDRAPRNSHLR
ncbi:hypothetical protein ASG30_16430 [Ramlibacter sp. Leaf400]|nr:hypothetical protein ASG30_16430 [Ramlibacter sp. Leaf400]